MTQIDNAKKVLEESRDTVLPFFGGILGELFVEKVLRASFEMINPSTARVSSLLVGGSVTGKYLYDHKDRRAAYALGGVACGAIASYLYDRYSTSQIIDSEGDEFLYVDAVSESWDQLTLEDQNAIINEIRQTEQITKDFYISEFRDYRTGEIPPDEFLGNVRELAKNLQVFRDEVGRQINIISAYRSRESNRMTNGKQNSLHLTASAADIQVEGMTPLQVFKKIQELINQGKMKQGGVGLYQNGRNRFVHYDVRGTRARWDDCDGCTRNIWR